MRISYCFCDNPCFEFEYDDIKALNALYRDRAPFGFRYTYGLETLMYGFLDSVIAPSSMEKVYSYTSKDLCYSIIEYKIDYIDHEDLSVYLIPFEDDLPL